MESAPTHHSHLEKVAVLIPAWKPGPQMGPVVEALLRAGISRLILVDDGSGHEFQSVFAALEKLPGVELIRNAVNLGKGRALKHGFNHFLNDPRGCTGLVTADADGQHLPEDTVRVAEAFLAADSKRVVLGARTFSKDVPLRSRFGNELTRKVFGLVTGRRLMDTQTGLRALPLPTLRELLPLDGERYEYEMTALAHVCRLAAPLEVPIQTVYIEGNRSSHFDPVRDSMRIYFVLFRFYLSSLVAAGIDFTGFTAAFWATHNILASVIIGRLSSLVNFALNKKYVFNSRAPVKNAIWRYYILVAVIASLSYGLLRLFTEQMHLNVFASKLLIDTALSFVSFSAQRTFVFRERVDPDNEGAL